MAGPQAVAAAASTSNPVGWAVAGGILVICLLWGSSEEEKKKAEEANKVVKAEFTSAMSAVQKKLEEIDKASKQSVALNSQKLAEIRTTYDEQTASNKANLEQYKLQAIKERKEWKTALDSEYQSLRDAVDKQNMELERVQHALEQRKQKALNNCREEFNLKQQIIQLQKFKEQRDVQEQFRKLQEQLAALTNSEIEFEAPELMMEEQLEFKDLEQELRQNEEERDQMIMQIENVHSHQKNLVQKAAEETKIAFSRMLKDHEFNIEELALDLKEMQFEISSQKELTEKSSRQSTVAVSLNGKQKKFQMFLGKITKNLASEADLKSMESVLSKGKIIPNCFEDLYERVSQQQASSANGPFVLGTGCSEVCPLIAFLQGSMKPEACWYKECKGTANQKSSHNKVTYQFCFDQNDPSKMKVVSFAPHVANN